MPADVDALAPLSRGELRRLAGAVPGAPAPVVPADPRGAASGRDLQGAFVRALRLGDLAAEVTAALQIAGYRPPRGAGTLVVGSFVGLRYDHPAARDRLERMPGAAATRGDGAYALWRVLTTKDAAARVRAVLAGIAIDPAPARRPRRCSARSRSWARPTSGPASRRRRAASTARASSSTARPTRRGWAAGRPTRWRGRPPRPVIASRPPTSRPGDVVLFGPRGAASTWRQVDHAGLALGGGWFVHSGSRGVTLDRLDTGYWAAHLALARRPG